MQLSSLDVLLTRVNSGSTAIFLDSGNEILGASGRRHWLRDKGMAEEVRDDGDDDEAALSKQATCKW